MKEKIKELKNVSWVKPRDLIVNILMVVSFSLVMGLLVYFIDLGIASLIPSLLR